MCIMITISGPVKAVYQDGWLKLLEPLELPDHQLVEILITASEEPGYRTAPEHVQQLREKANEWLVQQPIPTSTPKVSYRFTLTVDRTKQLRQIAETLHTSESEIIEKALDIYFDLDNLFEPQIERRGWHRLSEASLQRVWDNDQDAIYDNWRDLYDVPER